MEYKVNKIKLSPDAALQKMRHWCAYQERSQQETRLKLHEKGLNHENTEEIIALLVIENYINEERFALAFSGGKFRIKQWGNNKIRAELQKHKVPELLVNNALKKIDPEEYILTLQKVITKRIQLSDSLSDQKKFFDVLKYCISRGFESDLVNEQLKLTLVTKTLNKQNQL